MCVRDLYAYIQYIVKNMGAPDFKPPDVIIEHLILKVLICC